MKHRRLNIVGLLMLALAAAPRAHGADWPEWRGPNRDGVSSETNWLANWPPAAVWTANVGRGCGSVAVYDGRLYACGQSGDEGSKLDTVHCFNARTGESLWSNSWSVAGDWYGNMATPAVGTDRVFTYSSDAQLLSWDRLRGWGTGWMPMVGEKPGYNHAASPLVAGDAVIVNAGPYGIAVVREVLDYPLWGFVDEGPAPSYASPVPLTIDGTKYVAVIDENSVIKLVQIDGTDNTPAFALDLADPAGIDIGHIYADPIPYAGATKLFVAGDGGCAVLNVLDDPALALNWAKNYQTMRCKYMNALILDNHIYGCRYDAFWDGFAWEWHGAITCVSAADGTVRWSRELPDEGLTAIDQTTRNPVINSVAVGDRIVMLHESGRLNIMKASTNSFDLEERPWISPFNVVDDEGEYAAPVVADGLLYCRSANGELICYQIGPEGVLPDNDHDGLPDTWEQEHFLSRNRCDPAVDGDEDGHANGDEFITGTIPTDLDSVFRAEIARSGGKTLVSWEGTAAGGVGYDGRERLYTLERRTNLLIDAWQEVPGVVDVVGRDATIVHTNETSRPASFYRVRAELRNQ